MRALGLEFRLKEAKDTYKTHQSNTHVVDHDSDNLDDEEKVVYAAEFVWPSKSKPSSCPSLKPTQRNRQNEVKLLLMFLNVIVFFMNCLRMKTLGCLMLYHRRMN